MHEEIEEEEKWDEQCWAQAWAEKLAWGGKARSADDRFNALVRRTGRWVERLRL